MKMQIDLLRDLWGHLPHDLQRHESSMLAVLQTKIQAALTKVDGLIGSRGKTIAPDSIKTKYGKSNKVKYALVGKQSLESIITDLECWQTTFNRSFMMVAMVQSSPVESSIAKAAQVKDSAIIQMRNIKAAQQNSTLTTTQTSSIFIDPAQLRTVPSGAIEFSEALISTRIPSSDRVLVDRAPRSMAKSKVRDLARKFAGMDPSITHLLECQGVLEIPDTHVPTSSEFRLVFSIPERVTSIQTLRSVLVEGKLDHSLSARIRLATSLARSVIFLHEARFVHKNIRPETILLFHTSDNPAGDGNHDTTRTTTLGTPHLIGFEELREDDAETAMCGDNLPERNLYRHPHRQGLCPQGRYSVRHDIYSLGICLLEIGLWRSFVTYNNDYHATGMSSSSSCSDDDEVAAEILPEYTGIKPFQLKRQLEAAAESELPIRMGDIYAGVVLSCLTCLDPDNETFGDLQELEDEDGIMVGVRYIEKVRTITLHCYSKSKKTLI